MEKKLLTTLLLFLSTSSSLLAQASPDFRFGFINLGENGIHRNFLNKDYYVEYNCFPVGNTEHNCPFTSNYSLYSRDDSGNQIEIKCELTYTLSISTKSNSNYVLSYVYSIPIHQLMICQNRTEPTATFQSYNAIDKTITISQLVALDTQNNFALWKSRLGYGFSWIENDSLYFEACEDIQGCEHLQIYRSRVFSSPTLNCSNGLDFDQSCSADFERWFLDINILHYFILKLLR